MPVTQFKPAQNAIKHLVFDFEVKSFQEKKEGDIPVFEFKGYAAVFGNEDLVKDIIVKGAFKKSLESKSASDIMLFYQHEIQEMPIGILKSIKEDEHGLLVEPQLPLKNTRARDVAALIEVGGLTKFSIGFYVLDAEERDGINFIKEIDIFEVSVVNHPANPEASITEKRIPMSKYLRTKAVPEIVNFPIADEEHEWDNDEADARIRQFLDIEEPNAAYKNAHMWFDDESPENFTSYKLLFADVVGDELQAIPKAIFAIRGAIDGARAPLDVPERDIPALKRYVNHYYERMDLEAPFTEQASMDDEEEKEEKKNIDNVTTKTLPSLKHSEIVKILRENKRFSKAAAENMAKGYRFALKSAQNDNAQQDNPNDAMIIEKLSEILSASKLIHN